MEQANTGLGCAIPGATVVIALAAVLVVAAHGGADGTPAPATEDARADLGPTPSLAMRSGAAPR